MEKWGELQAYRIKLDHYTLPPLVAKVIKSMKKGEHCKVTTTKIDKKIRGGFVNEELGLDPYTIPDDAKVTFYLYLVDVDKPEYFYKLPLQEKLKRVLHLKDMAGKFFKMQHYAKAARIYQRVNGFYNFGDTNNNFLKEDETTEEWKALHSQIEALKVTLFVNLTVCKVKLAEWQSVTLVTEQIVQMDPKNVKALYFRGKAFGELKQYKEAIQTLTDLVKIDPEHVEARKLLKLTKETWVKEQEKESQVFAKMF